MSFVYDSARITNPTNPTSSGVVGRAVLSVYRWSIFLLIISQGASKYNISMIVKVVESMNK